MIGKTPTLVDLIARRANDRRGSARDERDAQSLGGHLLKTGIVGNKDVKHKRTCGLLGYALSPQVDSAALRCAILLPESFSLAALPLRCLCSGIQCRRLSRSLTTIQKCTIEKKVSSSREWK